MTEPTLVERAMTGQGFLDSVKPTMPKMKGLRFLSRAKEQLELLVGQTPLEQVLDEGGQLLEVGSGFGGTVFLLRLVGVRTFGIDPAFRDIKVSTSLCELAAISSPFSLSYGEELPFSDNQFDIVCSFETLEHVRDPAQVIAEMARVAKVDGHVLLTVPNYGSVIEGHFMLPWIPYMPRLVASLYVRLASKLGLTPLHPEYLDTLNLVTPRWLERVFCNNALEISDWGIDLWESRLKSLQLPDSVRIKPGPINRTLRIAIKMAARFRLLDLIVRFGRIWKMHYPIVLTARKRGVQSLVSTDRFSPRRVVDQIDYPLDTRATSVA